MKSRYIVLNQAFCNAHQGYGKDGNYFGFAITNNGDYVAAEQTLTDFPELFENDVYLFGIPVIELDSTTDFPQSLTP